VTSWAIVDYFLRPKPAYFAIKRELAPYTVGMARRERRTYPDALSAARVVVEAVLEVWGTNATLSPRPATLELAAFDLHSGWTERSERDVVLAPNSATELYTGAVPGVPSRTKESEVPPTIVVAARLLDKDSGAVLSRYANWYAPVSTYEIQRAY
jgi:beta-mannosidase